MIEVIGAKKEPRLMLAGAIASARAFSDRRLIAIYGKKRGIPNHIGTAHILQVGAKYFLVTAAHVIEESKNTTIYCGALGILSPIEGDFLRTTSTPDGSDPYDFAFLELIGNNLNLLHDYKSIPDCLISRDRASHSERFYTALGYPNSKNKSHDNANLFVTPRRAAYTSNSETESLAPLLGLDPAEHLVLTYEKRSYDEDFNEVNSIYLRGLSGGPVLDIGSSASWESETHGHPNPILSAMVVEYRKERRALVCVKSYLILEAINQHSLG